MKSFGLFFGILIIFSLLIIVILIVVIANIPERNKSYYTVGEIIYQKEEIYHVENGYLIIKEYRNGQIVYLPINTIKAATIKKNMIARYGSNFYRHNPNNEKHEEWLIVFSLNEGSAVLDLFFETSEEAEYMMNSIMNDIQNEKVKELLK